MVVWKLRFHGTTSFLFGIRNNGSGPKELPWEFGKQLFTYTGSVWQD